MGEGVRLGDPLWEVDGEPLHGDCEAVAEALEREGEAEAEEEAEVVREQEKVPLWGGVRLAEAVQDAEREGLRRGEQLRDADPDALRDSESVVDVVGRTVRVPVNVSDSVWDEALRDPLALALGVRVVVWLQERVRLCDRVALALRVPVRETDRVDWEGVALPEGAERVAEGVTERVQDAERDREGDSEGLWVSDKEPVWVGDGLAEPVPEPEALRVGVPLTVPRGLRETVLDGAERVGERVRVPVGLRLPGAETVSVRDPEPESEPEIADVPDSDVVWDVAVGVPVGLREPGVAVMLGLRDPERVAVLVAAAVVVAVGDEDRDPERVGVEGVASDAVAVAPADGERDAVSERLEERLREGVKVCVGTAETLVVGEGLREYEAAAVDVSVAVREVAETVALWEGLWRVDRVTVPLQEPDMVRDADALGV